jgi:RNA polymerase sigma-70 factor (ECF subfamily)
MREGPDPASDPASSSGSASLIARLQARDPSAWERLTRLYGPLVYAWARRANLRDEDAADVTQEVFQAVAQSLDSFRRDRPGDSFRGWLAGITRHKIQDQYRRLASQPEAAGGSTAAGRLQECPELPLEAAGASDDVRELAARAMALVQSDFQEHTWRAFLQTAVHGREPIDVAAELKMSIASVYSAKSCVLARLRQELADSLDEPRMT